MCEKSLVALEHLKMDECRARELEVSLGSEISRRFEVKESSIHI